MDINVPLWLMANGNFLADTGYNVDWGPTKHFDGKAVEYDGQGKVVRATNLKQDELVLQALSSGQMTLFLTVQYDASVHFKHEDNTIMCGLFGRCLFNFWKLVQGKYQLYSCNGADQPCTDVKTFAQGALRMAVNGNQLYVIEYDFNEVHDYRRPIVPRLSDLALYSLPNFELRNKKPVVGISDIEFDLSGDQFLEILYNDERDFSRYGIFAVNGQQTTRVGGFRPFEQLPNDAAHNMFHPYCQKFAYLKATGETVCDDGGTVQIIEPDKSITNPIYRRVRELVLVRGQVMIATRDGRILDIHQATEK